MKRPSGGENDTRPYWIMVEAVNLFGKTGISGKVLELLKTETIDSGHIHSIYASNEKRRQSIFYGRIRKERNY